MCQCTTNTSFMKFQQMEIGIRWNRFDTDAENWVGLKFSQIAMKKRSSQKDIIWGGGMSTSWWSSHHHPSHHNSLPKKCLQLWVSVDWVIIGHTICRHLLFSPWCGVQGLWPKKCINFCGGSTHYLFHVTIGHSDEVILNEMPLGSSPTFGLQ